MSAGISNLGMGFDPQRFASQPIYTQQELAAQQAEQQRAYAQQIAAIQAPTSPDAFLSNLARQSADAMASYYNTSPLLAGQTPADANALYQSTFRNLQEKMAANGNGAQADNLFGDGLLGTNFGQQWRDYVGSMDGRGPVTGASVPYGGQYAQQQADYQAQVAPIQQQANASATAATNAAAAAPQNQNLQQQAYGQQTGGGFAGGLLNPSYAQPFGNVLGFNGGMMGSGQAPAASTGLNPWMAPSAASSPSAANSGAWGGPFSNKNPWSLG